MSYGMTRRSFLKTLSSVSAGMLIARMNVVAQTIPRKPNVIVIIADDLGYAELGVQGCKDIPTPNIDSLALNGVRFTDGYVTCPVCAPTRAALLTGRYQQRFGFETNPGPEEYAAENFGLPRSELTIAERLKSLGYATGMVGKWHVGYKPELTPTQRGFDEFFGFLGGSHTYFPSERRSRLLQGDKPVEEKEYLTDAFAREAVAFIEKNATRPFFLYLAFNAVHSPLEAKPEDLARVENIQDRKRRPFAAMLIAMDRSVGRVLETLRQLRLEEHTLIFFLSDNGGPTPQTTSSNFPLRGYKGQVYEGGIRVPFIVQWKGHIPAGKVYRHPVSVLDILPTAIAAAGGEISPDWKLDGINLLPYLMDEKDSPPHDTLYWRFHQQRAIRRGDWKLVMGPNSTTWELYNLAEDIGERNNLAPKMPKKVKELETAWQEWNKQLMKPLWVRQGARTQRGRRKQAGQRVDGAIERKFREYDRNGDGKLTPDEFPYPRVFKQMDKNGDGIVTLDEAREFYLRARSR